MAEMSTKKCSECSDIFMGTCLGECRPYVPSYVLGVRKDICLKHLTKRQKEKNRKIIKE